MLPALDGGAGRAGRGRADLIVLTGDLAAGPQPVETLDRLAALGDRAVWIRGNADRELVELARGERAGMPDASSRGRPASCAPTRWSCWPGCRLR